MHFKFQIKKFYISFYLFHFCCKAFHPLIRICCTEREESESLSEFWTSLITLMTSFHSKEEGEKKMPCGSRKSCSLIGCTTPPLTAFLTGTRSSSRTWEVRSEKLLIPFSNFLMEVCRSPWLEYSDCIDVIINSLRTFPQTELSVDRWTRLLWLALDTNYKLAHKRNMDNLLTSLEDLHRFLMRVCSYW